MIDLTHYRSLWSDVASSIDHGIVRRKRDITVRVLDTAGRPLDCAPVRFEQIRSDFLFGANMFMLDAYDDAEIASAYAYRYVQLFNAATIPFYWKHLEPSPGTLRFAASSPRIRRRPPPDMCVEFCRKHRLNMNGHTLVWDLQQWSVPDWMSDNDCRDNALWERRIAQIAERYGSVISRWDVLNEFCAGGNPDRSRPMPINYHRNAFVWAQKYFPPNAFLMINEVTSAWHEPMRRQYVDLIRRLMAEGCRVDGVGIQFHLFTDERVREVAAGRLFSPQMLTETLDELGSLGLPIHVSEITLPSPRDTENGEHVQAELAENFYRLFFSHPAVHAITWWNFPDGGAAAGENTVDSGLVHPDMRPKAAYAALDRLINHSWRTQADIVTSSCGMACFRGFGGTYRVSAGSASAELSSNDNTVQLKETT